MIGSYLSVLRRRAVVIVLLAALLAPLMHMVLTSGEQTYQSGAVVQTGSNVAASAVGLSMPYEAPEIRLATEIDFFESDVVAERAWQVLSAQGWTESRQELDDRVTATPRGVSPQIDIVGIDSTAERAQQLTEAFANAYVAHRQETQRAVVQGVVEELQAQAVQAEADLVALGDPDLAPASARPAIDAARSWHDQVTNRIEEARLRLSLNPSGVVLLSPASPGEAVETIGTTTAALVALLGAFLAACGAALLLDVLRDPVRTREEAQNLLAVPALGELPQSGTGRRATRGALTDPAHPTMVGARGVRLRVERVLDGSAPRTALVVAAPSDASDAVTVAVALAASWHRAGLRAAVVADVDQHQGRLAQLLQPSDKTQTVDLGLTARATASGVWLVPATRDANGHPGFLDQPSPAATLSGLHRAFDVVILVDSRSSALDAVAVSHLSDIMLVVCALGRTPAKRVKELIHTLDDYGAKVDGLVFTRPWWHRRRRRGGAPRHAAPGDQVEPNSRVGRSGDEKDLPADVPATPASTSVPSDGDHRFSDRRVTIRE
jgi:capsular polysaccharide biosynthesis protein